MRIQNIIPKNILAALLCALFALSGFAQARMQGEKAENSSFASPFALCFDAAESGGDSPAPNHDCDDCCRVAPAGLITPPAAQSLFISYPASPNPQRQVLLVRAIYRQLPWSTGPPMRG